jgi:hypothetical protein
MLVFGKTALGKSVASFDEEGLRWALSFSDPPPARPTRAGVCHGDRSPFNGDADAPSVLPSSVFVRRRARDSTASIDFWRRMARQNSPNRNCAPRQSPCHEQALQL